MRDLKKSILTWFSQVEMMDGSRLGKRIYCGKCVGNWLAESPRRKVD